MKHRDTMDAIFLHNMTVTYGKWMKWANIPNVTFIVNFGWWIRSARSDAVYINGTQMVDTKSESNRLELYTQICTVVAQWFQSNLQGDNVAFWQGLSPGPEDGRHCGELSPWSEAQHRALRIV